MQRSRVLGLGLVLVFAPLGAQAPTQPSPQQPAPHHWAFVAPTRPPLPAVQQTAWPHNAIDAFVLARLEHEGLQPSPEADRGTLLRRLSLELTGLPPTLSELDAFAADAAADAYADDYDRAVERLLASPRAAEHQARYWLDAARYGDTHGMESDNERTLWPWRDWVIDSFARNQPFDQFTIEQLAGDLLPGATAAQRVATGFHRNNMSTAEGGLIEDELLVRYAAERAEVTGTVWLGLTVGCARCHDHKYDPITQRDYYALFDFFHSIDERGSNDNAQAPPPNLPVPDPGLERRLADFDEELAELRQARDEFDPALAAEADAWAQKTGERLRARWRVLAVASARAQSGTVLTPDGDGSVVASGAMAPDQDVYVLEGTVAAGRIGALRIEALRERAGSGPANGPGRADNGNFVLTGLEVRAATGDGGAAVDVNLHDAVADFAQRGFPPANALDADPASGWAVLGAPGDHALVAAADAASAAALPADRPLRLSVTLRFQSPYPRHELRRFRLAVAADAPPPRVVATTWHQCGPFPTVGPTVATAPGGALGDVLATESAPAPPAGSAFAFADLADEAVHALPAVVGTTLLQRTLFADAETEAMFAFGSDDGIGVWLDGERLLAHAVQRGVEPDQEIIALPLHAGENSLLVAVVNTGGPAGFFCRQAGLPPDGVPPAVAAALHAEPRARTAEQVLLVRAYWRQHHDPSFVRRGRAIAVLEQQRAEAAAGAPMSMVMRERNEPRPSFVLQRGRYDLPQQQVHADVPAFLPPLPPGAVHDRLALAHWLAQKNHPLTARVTVNRLWQQVFGRGLVDTPHDFGTKGSRPTHQDLLDWLACEFVDSGWDQRHMLRLMVTSSTWRQSSAATPALLQRDPDNRLLARAGRRRLDAEVIRDQALLLAGLLVERRGGPSVRPYQPPGVWEAVAFPSSNTRSYAQDRGEGLYRRSLYTFWKRTAPPALMALLDAPSRETCAVFRERTDTPLQALALLNDTGFAEAARAFAQRLLQQPGDDDARLCAAFRACTARQPADGERTALAALLARARSTYAADPAAAGAAARVGDSPLPAGLDAREVAAFAVVAAVLLNLDATLSRS